MENRASVEIIEQPAKKSFRFRYESEGRLSGSIVGENATKDNPTYPTLRIKNYTGTISIRITCVTRELNGRVPKQHPHKVSTKDLREGGEAYSTHILGDSGEVQFKDIGIIFVKRQDIKESLTNRRREEIDPTGGGWNHIEKKEHFDLHNVCLCFEVFKYYEPSPFSFPIGYVISKPITDKKSNAALKIIEISSTTASVLGGDKIILLCDKVKREDISVIFYENAKKQEIVWREEVNYKNSASMKVHHQYAISFQTPKYREFDIIEPKKVFIELYRPSDNERSEPISFELLPNNAHSIQLRRKKQKKLHETVKETLRSSYASPMKKVDKPKFVPNIQVGNTKGVNGQPLTRSNRNNAVERPANPPILINLSEENKENVNMSLNNHVQNTYQQASVQQQYQRPMTINPYDDQYSFPCGTYSNSNFPSYYYTPMGQDQNVNGLFDEPSNAQAPQYNSRAILLPNIYQQQQQQQQQQQHHQQQQQQHNIQSNVFANGQHQNHGYIHRTISSTVKNSRNSHMNCMPLTYNNDNNKHATDYSVHSGQAMNITSDQSRLSELEQQLNKSEMMNLVGTVNMVNDHNDEVLQLSGGMDGISLSNCLE